jgi:hypothetical protein
MFIGLQLVLVQCANVLRIQLANRKPIEVIIEQVCDGVVGRMKQKSFEKSIGVNFPWKL